MKITVTIIFVWLFYSLGFGQDQSISWENIQTSGEGTVTVYWFNNNPFGYKDAKGEMKGIEVEIMKGFQNYLKDTYDIDLTINWVQETSFMDVLTQIKDNTKSGVFGVAGFSLTEERREFMKFTPSYMADVAVLVSTQDIPIIKSEEELKVYFEGATAITPKGSILETDLINLQNEFNVNFNIEYNLGGYQLINAIREGERSFGYVSLLIYLMDLNNGFEKLNRQNYLTKTYEGHGLALTKSSDWDVPITEYFNDPSSKIYFEALIGQYANIDLYHFIEKLNPENEVSILNMEKSLQQMRLKMKELVIKDRNEKQVYLLGIIVIGILFFVVTVILLLRLNIDHKLLKEQKVEIEAQADEILLINNNLELIIEERMRELETKNKALEEYSFITAHKLRAPLASILGLISLLENASISKEDKQILERLTKSANGLDVIVHEILDAIDKPDFLSEKE